MGGFWTRFASTAYLVAVSTGWKWPRRVEAWAWHWADTGKEQ
jgi:hypothetical protein